MHTLSNVRNALLLVLLCAQSVQAAPKTNTGNAAIVKAQGMIRQLIREKSALQAEKDELETQIAELENAAARVPLLQAELQQYKDALAATRGNLEGQLNQAKQSRQALLERHNTVVGKAKTIHSDNLLLVKAVQEREQWIQRCGEQVQKLQQINQEILESYRDKGFLSKLAELEPFTGIGQARTEAVVEDYIYQLKQLQITPYEVSDAVPAAVPAESPVPNDEAQP